MLSVAKGSSVKRGTGLEDDDDEDIIRDLSISPFIRCLAPSNKYQTTKKTHNTLHNYIRAIILQMFL